MRSFIISSVLSAIVSLPGTMPVSHAKQQPVVMASTEAPAWLDLPADASFQRVRYDGIFNDNRSSGNLVIDFDAAANVASFTRKLAQDGFIVAAADGYVAADPVTGRTLRLTKGSYFIGEVWRVSFIDPAPRPMRFVD